MEMWISAKIAICRHGRYDYYWRFQKATWSTPLVDAQFTTSPHLSDSGSDEDDFYYFNLDECLTNGSWCDTLEEPGLLEINDVKCLAKEFSPAYVPLHNVESDTTRPLALYVPAFQVCWQRQKIPSTFHLGSLQSGTVI